MPILVHWSDWRVAAELCRDDTMIQEIVDKVDIHTANAIAIFGDAKYRQEAKTVSFRSLANSDF